MNFLDLLEGKLQTLVEGNLDLFLERQAMQTLIQALSKTIDTYTQINKNGAKTAPDLFVVQVSQEPYDYWTSRIELINNIALEIYNAGLEAGLKFNLYPRLQFELTHEIKSSEIKINGFVSMQPKPIAPTEVIHFPNPNLESEQVPQNSFVIVNGKTTYPLKKAIINIGRMSTNDICLSDLHVSRKHIQLRVVEGNFILFDLGSVGGTFVNGQICKSAKLVPGDVIKIGITTLIYFQDKHDQIHSTEKYDLHGEKL